MLTSSSNNAWSGSPFSSSGSTRSNAVPSPSSSPSASSYVPAQQGQQTGSGAGTTAPSPYGPKTDYSEPHGQLRSGAGYEGSLGVGAGANAGYFPIVHRSETPSMDSRPQTASSYDGAANFAINGHGRPVDATGRHSSAPVNSSGGGQQTNSGYNTVPQVSSSMYYGASGAPVDYSPPHGTGSETTAGTGAYRGSPSMDDYQTSASSHASGYAVSTATSDSGYGCPSTGFADGSVTAAATRVGQWVGTDYHSTPSPPDSMAVDMASQQPVQAQYPSGQTNDAMRYFHTSGTP